MITGTISLAPFGQKEGARYLANFAISNVGGGAYEYLLIVEDWDGVVREMKGKVRHDRRKHVAHLVRVVLNDALKGEEKGGRDG